MHQYYFGALAAMAVAGCGAPVAPADSDPWYERQAAWMTVESTGTRTLGVASMAMFEALEGTCRGSTAVGWSDNDRSTDMTVRGWFPTDDVLTLPAGGTSDVQVQQQHHRSFQFPWRDGTMGFPGDGDVWLELVGEGVRVGVQAAYRCDLHNEAVPTPYPCEAAALSETYLIEWHDPSQRFDGNQCVMRSDTVNNDGLCTLGEVSTPDDCVASPPGSAIP